MLISLSLSKIVKHVQHEHWKKGMFFMCLKISHYLQLNISSIIKFNVTQFFSSIVKNMIWINMIKYIKNFPFNISKLRKIVCRKPIIFTLMRNKEQTLYLKWILRNKYYYCLTIFFLLKIISTGKQW